ncbi:MAG: M20/M25/M40 family metallo-hydrolase, partial [Candidatus Nanohaloarchaea archaeon]
VRIGIDARYQPRQDVDRIRRRIDSAVGRAAEDYDVELRVDHGGAFELDDDGFRDTVTEVVENVTSGTPEHVTEGGGSDGRFFAVKGTPFVELGTAQETAHAADEHCRVDTLEKLRKSYSGIARKVADR